VTLFIGKLGYSLSLSPFFLVFYSSCLLRDIKPENLLLSDSSEAATLKLGDFGFAAYDKYCSLTEEWGTYHYMAPEILLRQPYGKGVDMWSFGIVLFALLGGYFPFDNENNDIHTLKTTIKKGEFYFDEEMWSNITAEAKDLITKLLTVDPAKRVTAEQALNHSWMKMEEAVLEQKELAESLQALRNYKTPFKGAAHAMIYAKRWLKKTKQRTSDLLSLPLSPVSTTSISSRLITSQRQSSFFSCESGDSCDFKSSLLTETIEVETEQQGQAVVIENKKLPAYRLRSVVTAVISLERMKRAVKEKKRTFRSESSIGSSSINIIEVSLYSKVYNFIYLYFLSFLLRFFSRK
jgi:serine/threonine protein kinase